MEGKDRQLLIDIGEKMREIDKDVWLKTLMQDYYDEPKLVVSDVRMMNEYKFLKSQGFIFVRIYSDDVTRASREGFDPFAEKDRTETEIGEIPCDFLLVNEGTLEELELMTETLADMWLGI